MRERGTEDGRTRRTDATERKKTIDPFAAVPRVFHERVFHGLLRNTLDDLGTARTLSELDLERLRKWVHIQVDEQLSELGQFRPGSFECVSLGDVADRSHFGEVGQFGENQVDLALAGVVSQVDHNFDTFLDHRECELQIIRGQGEQPDDKKCESDHRGREPGQNRCASERRRRFAKRVH